MAAGAFAALSDVGESRHGPRRSRWVFTHMVKIDIAVLTLLVDFGRGEDMRTAAGADRGEGRGTAASARKLYAARYPSNVRCRANRDAPWEIWRGPRFPSCKLASYKPVTARSCWRRRKDNAYCHCHRNDTNPFMRGKRLAVDTLLITGRSRPQVLLESPALSPGQRMP